MTPSAGAGMPLRDYRVHRYVNAFCPHCHEEDPDRDLAEVRRLSGWLAVRDGRVWLERGCPDHGFVRTLYDEDAEILSYLEQWTAPTKVHAPDIAGNFKPVPSAYEDGLPQMQTQHTCILLQDLTDHCNLRCPTCFAEDLAATAGVDRSALVPLVRAAVDAWAGEGAATALTGPIARGDHETVARQRAAVAERAPERLALFDALAAATRELAAATAAAAASEEVAS